MNTNNHSALRRVNARPIWGATIFLIMVCSSLLLRSSNASAQIITQDWTLTEPNFDSLKWGAQEIVIQVRNNSDKYKFFSVTCRTLSPLRRFSEVRVTRSNDFFMPDEEKAVSFVVDVPENLSYVTLEIGFYDVVDTLDNISKGKEIYKHKHTITPASPRGLERYSNITPKAGSILKFNSNLRSDLSLLIHAELREPASISDVAKRMGASYAMLSRVIRVMEENGLVSDLGNNTFRSSLTIIEGLPAEEIKELIDTTVAQMVASLESSLPKYLEKHQEMMDAGLATLGEKETLEGTGMLHHLFPMVGGIVLWEAVGAHFLVGGDGPAQVVNLQAPCDMLTDGYGYVILDKNLRDGDDFYYYDPSDKRRIFGHHVPAVLCTRSSTRAVTSPSYYLPSRKTTLMYTYSKARSEAAVKVLGDPLISIRDEFSEKVSSLFVKSDVKLLPAHRLWLWNRLVTSTMNKLESKKVLNGRGVFYTWKERDAK